MENIYEVDMTGKLVPPPSYAPLVDYSQEAAINGLAHNAGEVARNAGWYDDEVARTRTLIEEICLVHTELSEAVEEIRNHRREDEIYFREDGKPEGVAAELADAIIRIFDSADNRGIPLGEAFALKMAFNRTRPHRHGGKAF
jgi:NTP pyrophosphatase (non-canonical NTP hydrolase)